MHFPPSGTDHPQDFVSKMLTIDPEKRPSAGTLLNVRTFPKSAERLSFSLSLSLLLFSYNFSASVLEAGNPEEGHDSRPPAHFHG
jgi:serine/threonine protein kinase